MTGTAVTSSPSSSGSTIKAGLVAQAMQLGFDDVRITDAALDQTVSRNFDAFVAGGYHGDMSWLEDTADRRRHPQSLWPEAKSVVSVAINYGPDHNPLHRLQETNRGVVSVYAQGRDYHDILKKRLKALARWLAETAGADVKIFVDTAPVLEKPVAESAGLGWQGKHTNLVSRRFGSWLFLGELFTTLALEPDAPEGDHCGVCRQCLDICPTSAFLDDRRIDARRCISYLTIEHKGPIPRELRPMMGNRIYGCDDCLAVCPWNKFAVAADQTKLKSRPDLAHLPLADLAQLTDEDFRDLFAGTPIKRTGRDRFVRNVLIAAGNSGDVSLADHAEQLCSDDSAVVRGAAVWALQRLRPARASQLAKSLGMAETDPDVRAEWSAS